MRLAANLLINRVQQQNLLSRGERLLLGVSGGPDSVCLLLILHDLQKDYDLHLEVAHLQHGIRGEEAADDARFVGALAEQLGLIFHLREINLPELRRRAGKGNLEALAREQRYKFFAEIAQRRGLTKIATAHTEDDQAETMLMWLLRGAGRKGLGGMSPVHAFNDSRRGLDQGEAQIIRPFLKVSKSEILNYLHERQIAYRVDSTNDDGKLLRNWIRLELLPQLRLRIDGRVSARLAEQAAMLRGEQAVLEQVAYSALENCRRNDGLDRVQLLQQPVALQRLIFRYWIERLRGDLRGIDFVHVEALRRVAATGPSQARIAIPGGWELRREYDLLYLSKAQRGLKPICYCRSLTIGQTLQIPEANVELVSETLAAPVRAADVDMTQACFDLQALPEPLLVRNFRRGDRFEPLGMSGQKKLKDLFIDRKVALSERSILPLLVGGDKVIWIPGHGRSRSALVGPNSRAIMRIKVIPLGT
jgi:tRNA(Ile)-lysidine synthase